MFSRTNIVTINIGWLNFINTSLRRPGPCTDSSTLLILTIPFRHHRVLLLLLRSPSHLTHFQSGFRKVIRKVVDMASGRHPNRRPLSLDPVHKGTSNPDERAAQECKLTPRTIGSLPLMYYRFLKASSGDRCWHCGAQDSEIKGVRIDGWTISGT